MAGQLPGGRRLNKVRGNQDMKRILFAATAVAVLARYLVLPGWTGGAVRWSA